MKLAQPSRQSGSTVAAVMLITLVLGVFVALAADYTGNIGRNAQRDRVFNAAVEIGDGCLEIAFGGWRKLSATAENPPTSTFNAIPSPTSADFPSFPGAVISNFDVQAVDPFITLASDNPPVSALGTTVVPPKTTGPGSGTFSYFYLATADVTLPYMSGTLTAKVRRVFEKRYTSTWNWAMLFNDDLELHPESPMKLTGWVHSNKNVYVGNGSPPLNPPPPTNVLLEDRLTYAGNYQVAYSPLNGTHVGWGNAADPQAPLDLPPGSEQIYSPFGLDSTKFIPGGSSANDDGYREMIEMNASGTDLLQKERLYNQANIAITIDASNVVRVYTGMTTIAGSSKTLATGSGGGLSANAYNAAAESITTGSSIQDNREQGSGPVRVVNFDVKEFMDRFPASKSPDAKNFNPSQDWNGIVYISDTSGSATTKRAIRIRNGARLPTGGMTIVSDNPVYIEGDFNTGRTKDASGNVTAETPSNLTGATYEDPDVAGYQRRPASIMADAISLLSNNWNASYDLDASMSTRVASNTTVNAALVAGNVPSSLADGYSGGGEHFVRLLEDWTGKSFTYYGSIVCVFRSAQGVGPWSTSLFGNVYRPANQHWYFDTTLSVDADGEPVRVPGHISTVAYLQQQRWYLQY